MLAYSPLSWWRYNITSTRNLALRLNHMTYSMLYLNEHEVHPARRQSLEFQYLCPESLKAREIVTYFLSVCVLCVVEISC